MKHTACFFEHRDIIETEELRAELRVLLKRLIVEKLVDTFLFGSKSRFDALCRNVVTELQKIYPHIKRIYVRAEYPVISEDYTAYLMTRYDDTDYPESIRKSGRAAYVERNYVMIDRSQFCVVYYDETHAPVTRKSGTKIALDYAVRQKKEIYLLSASGKTVVGDKQK